MRELDFEWQIDEYMVYCRSRQLREKTMNSYEQTLRLFARWCQESMAINSVDKVTESVVRKYISTPQESLYIQLSTEIYFKRKTPSYIRGCLSVRKVKGKNKKKVKLYF